MLALLFAVLAPWTPVETEGTAVVRIPSLCPSLNLLPICAFSPLDGCRLPPEYDNIQHYEKLCP